MSAAAALADVDDALGVAAPLPRSNGELVFEEVWQGRALGLGVVGTTCRRTIDSSRAYEDGRRSARDGSHSAAHTSSLILDRAGSTQLPLLIEDSTSASHRSASCVRS
jgi:hypothetical protein